MLRVAERKFSDLFLELFFRADQKKKGGQDHSLARGNVYILDKNSLNSSSSYCGEGQTESHACVLSTERKVSFRVEASARTMTKESS